MVRGTGFCAGNAHKTACPEGRPFDRESKRGWRRCSTGEVTHSRNRYRRLRNMQPPVAVLAL
ncbi:hypothetical protein GCM10023194_39170 [Planotetraspora phitsanulokensis]|uniref:Uncharacterized protein n=1 Tax=Planotetraspora phitsanulokensis TaxID=575192 RepID=A0A8J3XJ26_9ACTN|nr:hypothetical protein Pph01_65590 [Planotetraspora phitsanulokensis]